MQLIESFERDTDTEDSTRVPSPITAGQAQAITYATNDTSSPVTIILRKGAAGNLDTIETLTDSANNGQYIWTPSSSLENDNDYALEINQNGQVNYFGPFSIQGASGSSSSSRSSSITSTASAYTTGYVVNHSTHTNYRKETISLQQHLLVPFLVTITRYGSFSGTFDFPKNPTTRTHVYRCGVLLLSYI